jgi:hypothetical protein
MEAIRAVEEQEDVICSCLGLFTTARYNDHTRRNGPTKARRVVVNGRPEGFTATPLSVAGKREAAVSATAIQALCLACRSPSRKTIMCV